MKSRINSPLNLEGCGLGRIAGSHAERCIAHSYSNPHALNVRSSLSGACYCNYRQNMPHLVMAKPSHFIANISPVKLISILESIETPESVDCML